MSKNKKKVTGANAKEQRRTAVDKQSTENCKIVWKFDLLDKTGLFAFDLMRPDFNHELILRKIIDYSNMTWSEIRRATHDKGKSHHHFLDTSGLSKSKASG